MLKYNRYIHYIGIMAGQEIKVASFFSGIGGFDLGFERAGMQIVFQSEINEFCRAVLKKHWPDVKLMGDIKDIKIDDIPRDADVWCAGFPCQDVSLANQGKRVGIDGERSGLFFRFAKLVVQRKPKIIVLENVIGLLNSNEGEDFRRILETLDEFGYVCAWRVLDAQYFRTPQRRRRILVVASRGDASAGEILLDPRTIKTLLKKSNGAKRSATKDRDNVDEKTDYVSIQHGCIGRNPGSGPQGKGWRADGKTWTLDSRGSSDVICSTSAPLRMRTPTGISKGMDSRRYRAIGNAVPVPVTTWLGKRIVQTFAGKND